jgi:hypothetical protein
MSGFEVNDNGDAVRRNADGTTNVIGVRAFMDALVRGDTSIPVTTFRPASLLDALIHHLPDHDVAAGAICVAAELRVINGEFQGRNRPAAIEAEPGDGNSYGCYYASDEFSEVCFGQVQNGAEVAVTSADNSQKGCLKAAECAIRLTRMETI